MVLSFLATNGTAAVIPSVLAKYRVVAGSVTSFYSDRFAMERFSTLDRLARENPSIRECYPEAFRAAEARGYYYKARYLIGQKKYKEGSAAIKAAAELDKKFVIFKALSRWPWMWNLLHRVKGRLAPYWLRLTL